jgi:hypothetical protein
MTSKVNCSTTHVANRKQKTMRATLRRPTKVESTTHTPASTSKPNTTLKSTQQHHHHQATAHSRPTYLVQRTTAHPTPVPCHSPLGNTTLYKNRKQKKDTTPTAVRQPSCTYLEICCDKRDGQTRQRAVRRQRLAASTAQACCQHCCKGLQPLRHSNLQGMRQQDGRGCRVAAQWGAGAAARVRHCVAPVYGTAQTV